MSTNLLWIVSIISLSTGAFCEEGTAHLLLKSAVTVVGTVVDSSDNPIPNVTINHIAVEKKWGTSTSSALSDAGGFFRFQTIGPAVVFRKDGLKSVLVRVSDHAGTIRVVMDLAPPPQEEVTFSGNQECVSLGHSAFSNMFCLPRTSGVEIGNVDGTIDATEVIFITRTVSGRSEMDHGAGPSWDGPFSRDQEIWDSVRFDERTRKFGHTLVVDAHGQTSDGKFWRHVGVLGESAFYRELDKGAATVFDRVLDGLRLIEENPK